MIRFSLFLLIGIFSIPVHADPFDDFLIQLNIAPSSERQALVDSFMNDLPGGQTPVLSDSAAHFVYTGTASSVAIAGDANGWSPYEDYLFNISPTNFWYRTWYYPLDARLDYKFVLDNTTWILDPHNPNTCAGGYGPNSELAMPEYVQPLEIEDYGYTECEITSYEDFYSPQLDNYRTIQVVTPPGYDPEGAYSTLIVHDGLEYISLGYLSNIMSYMAVHFPWVDLPICVCIPPVNRTEEYAGSQQDEFGQFIMNNVVPHINENFATVPGNPTKWGSMGASNGGNISLYLGGTYPGQFRKLLIMSPYIPQAQYDLILNQPADTYEIYLNWGTYDIESLIPLIETFNTMMEDREIVHFKQRYNEGHSWGLWRATTDQGFMFLFGGGVHAESEEKASTRELSVYPNPFYSATTISFQNRIYPSTLEIFNLAGREVFSYDLPAGTHTWKWSPASEIAAGRYIAYISDDTGSAGVPLVYLK